MKKSTKNRGSLKIFLGYTTGVGKTYTMLEEARELKENGKDVVLGALKSNDHPQTLKQAQGIEQIPSQKLFYHGSTYYELDLDAVQQRRPEILVVDELGHTNVPGTRHEARYQDIVEALEAGIDIYTTMNITDLQSLSHHLANETLRGVVPNFLFEKADVVRLVDIDPQALYMRLAAEKGMQFQQFSSTKKEHLLSDWSALRKIALHQMNLRSAKHEQKSERLLVCITDSSLTAKVLYSTAELASAFNCQLLGVYVSTELDTSNYSKQLTAYLDLAAKLEIEVTPLYGTDAASLIADYAEKMKVTKIFIGAECYFWWERLLKNNLAEQLNELVPNIDKYVISTRTSGQKREFPTYNSQQNLFNMKDFVKMLLVLAGSTLIGEAFQVWNLKTANIILIYILGVMITATVTHGRRYSIFYSCAMVLLYNYFFTAPYISFKSEPRNIVTFLIMFIVSFLASTWTSSLRSQTRLETQRATRTEILLKTSRQLQQTWKIMDVYRITGQQLAELLDCEVCVFSARGDNFDIDSPLVFGSTHSSECDPFLTQQEKKAAAWVVKNGKRAGYKTKTMSFAHGLYIPLKETVAKKKTYAVAGLDLRQSKKSDPFTLNLAFSICRECGEAVARIHSSQKQSKSERAVQQEKFRNNLLRGISHDLRTPLTTITGNSDMLLHSEYELQEDQKKQLYHAIHADSLWLNNLVENLLAMTKIDNDPLETNRQPELVDDILQTALAHVNEEGKKQQFKVSLADPVLMVNVDAQLIMQVVINIVNNALQNSPEGSLITIDVQATPEHQIKFEIYNNGPHLPSNKIFELFYTKQNQVGRRQGLGIGLALCKSIIEMYGGQIFAKNVFPQGVCFTFYLPQWTGK